MPMQSRENKQFGHSLKGRNKIYVLRFLRSVVTRTCERKTSYPENVFASRIQKSSSQCRLAAASRYLHCIKRSSGLTWTLHSLGVRSNISVTRLISIFSAMSAKCRSHSRRIASKSALFKHFMHSSIMLHLKKIIRRLEHLPIRKRQTAYESISSKNYTKEKKSDSDSQVLSTYKPHKRMAGPQKRVGKIKTTWHACRQQKCYRQANLYQPA